ncbi:MAG: purine and other phosphorylase-like protein, family 1 [Pseudomonadales bacterium]
MSGLGFVVAMGAEVRALGVLHRDWMVELSGIGPEAAMVATRKLAARGSEAIISWGTAGGLSSVLSIGDLVVPEQVRRDEHLYCVDARLRSALAQSLGVPIHGGTLITTDEVIRTPETKAELHRTHGAVAVDMESAAIAEAAADHGLPFAAIRAISDTACDALPRGITLVVDSETGMIKPSGVARLLLTRPHLVPQLVRTGRQFGKALSMLRAAAGAMRDNAQG